MDLMKEAYRGGIDRILTYLPKGWFAGDLVSEIFDEGWDLWEKANLKDRFQSSSNTGLCSGAGPEERAGLKNAGASQCHVIGTPKERTWDDYEENCKMTFGGGYREKEEADIFRHGMGTIFNLLRAEFPEPHEIGV